MYNNNYISIGYLKKKIPSNIIQKTFSSLILEIEGALIFVSATPPPPSPFYEVKTLFITKYYAIKTFPSSLLFHEINFLPVLLNLLGQYFRRQFCDN